jgi:exopolysaccharide biosynthesis polyprenyl glycosylphosphotransferase
MNSMLDKLTPGWPAKANLAFDLVVLFGASALALQAPPLDDPSTLTLALLGFLAWIFGAAVLRLYSPMTPRTAGDHLTLTLLLVVGVSASLSLWERVILPDAHRFSVTTFCIVVLLWTMSGRVLVFQPLRAVAGPVEEILICGVGPAAVATAHRLRRQSGGRRFRLVGFLAFEGEPTHMTIARGAIAPVLGSAADLLEVLEKSPVSEVYIAGRPLVHGKEMQQIVHSCEQIGMPFALPVHAMQLERARLLSSSSATDGYLHYISTDTRPMQYAVKRLVDIACSATALVLLSPLLVGVAIAIKLTSPGPILFRQQRVGLHGASFNLLKFRSMVADADEMKDKLLALNEQTGPVFKMKRDPRVTAVGRFIRKFSIDELPQLVNILRGDMTIVGPRPAIPREVAQYRLWQRRRLSVRPGLTCYWQVGGRNAIGFEEWMQLDLRYVDNWSLVEDMKLILATFPVVILGRGAS